MTGPAGGPAPGLRYCGFWIRLAALLIDEVVIAGVTLALLVTARGVVGPSAAALALFVIAWTAALLWLHIGMVGRFGGTVGMRLLTMTVVREADGSQVGYALALGRSAALIGLFLFPVIGIFMIAASALLCGFDERKQAIHDKICSTLVVRPA